MTVTITHSPGCGIAAAPTPACVTPDGTTPPAHPLTISFAQNYQLVYRFLLHRSFNPELADELTAETFYRAARYVHRLPSGDHLIRAWLLRIAMNLATTRQRRERVRQFFLARFGHTAAGAAASVPALDGEPDAHVRRVRRGLLALPAKYQSIIILRYYLQMPYEEIAAVLGMQLPATRRRLSRALAELRDRLGSQASPSPR
jgi:RNA polymerase sigma-70 factor (ECF subfamily)